MGGSAAGLGSAEVTLPCLCLQSLWYKPFSQPVNKYIKYCQVHRFLTEPHEEIQLNSNRGVEKKQWMVCENTFKLQSTKGHQTPQEFIEMMHTKTNSMKSIWVVFGYFIVIMANCVGNLNPV